MIKRALISVYNKEGIVELAKFLSSRGVELLSSGGTATKLRENGIDVIDVSKITGTPEMMDGRVKTLHPKIHGAILADRSNPNHLLEAEKNGILLIDLVILNLYPFKDTVLQGAEFSEVIENIDVGGPALLRAAAKNYGSVLIVTNPSQYPKLIEEIRNGITPAFRERLAIDAWNRVAHYDVLVEKYFRRQFGLKNEYPEFLNLTFRKKQDLRYGENPFQTSSLYYDEYYTNPSVLHSDQLQGKLLSYNNILDCNAAFKLIREFNEPTAVIIKHNNPCGVASGETILEALKNAKAVDPHASFGGIVAINRPVDKALAEEIVEKFVEIVIAPKYDLDAEKIFSQKKNIRVLLNKDINTPRKEYRKYRSVLGGLLVQEANVLLFDELKVVTKRDPNPEELEAMKYAWTVAKYVKSNAIVYARPNRVVGIGAGQMKRVDAAKLGAMIANDYGETLDGCAMASDAFFPFRDGIDFAAKLNIKAVIQPGGSIRDQEVIDAANEHGMTMVFTGIRHFRH